MDPAFSTALRAFVLSVAHEAVGPAVRNALVEALPAVARRAALPIYLTRAEVCDLTGWSDRKLSYLQARRRIPFVKRGRTVLFRTADIEAYLDEGRVEARASAVQTGRGL